MGKSNIHTIKAYLTISVFILFWMMTFAFVFPTKIFRKKTPKLAWNYDQVFGQKWNFFTQPYLYNDRIVFVLKNVTTMQVADSIDVLNELWKQKQSNAPFNTKEDILDHIMLKQTARLRAGIEDAQVFIKESNKDSANQPWLKQISSLIEADKVNANTIHNIEAFGKIILKSKGINIDKNIQYKILFYTDFISTFKHSKSKQKKCTLDFESSYKYFK